MDSCAAAHLTTVVLRRLVLRHGPRRWGGGLCLVSDALRSLVFDLLRRIASIANDFQTGCQKKNRLLFCGFHPHPTRSALTRYRASYFFGSKLEDNDVIKRVYADEATIFCLVRACVARSLRGAALG